MGVVQYFVIYGDEDGIHISDYSEKEIKKLLSWDTDANCIGMKIENACDRFLYLNEIDFDNTDFADACVIIKGEVVKPKAKEVVKQFEIE